MKQFTKEDAEYLFWHPQAKIVRHPEYPKYRYKVLKNES